MKTASLGRQIGGFLVAFFVCFPAVAVGPPLCPWYEPPSTVPTEVVYKWKLDNGPYIFSDPQSACASRTYTPPRTLCNVLVTSANSAYCQQQFAAIGGGNGACGDNIATAQRGAVGSGCPDGYTWNGSVCALTDPSVLACPPSNCPAGSYVGHATFSSDEASFYADECYQGCAVNTKDQVKIGSNIEGVFRVSGDWYRTGAPCASVNDRWNQPINADMPPPIEAEAPIGSPDYFCQRGELGGEYCAERFSRGCGTINGSRICASDFRADSTGCKFIGKNGYVCVGSWPGPGQPASGPPRNPPSLPGNSPKREVHISFPGDGSGNHPNGGPGEWIGPNAGQGGQYKGDQRFSDQPGGDGNGNPEPGTGGGTGSGSDPVQVQFDKSGLATEGTQSNILGKLGEIKDKLAEFGEGEGGLSTNFNGATSGEHDPIDKSAEIEALKAELQTTLDNIKTESSTLFDFTEGGSFSCPPDWAIEFNGHTFSLCPDWLIESLEPLGSAVLFMAAMLAAFIVLR